LKEVMSIHRSGKAKAREKIATTTWRMTVFALREVLFFIPRPPAF
jgi:hypothetical protein